MGDLVTKEHWEKSWDESNVNSDYEVKKIVFSKLFKKYLKKNQGKKALEIGCFPGLFLTYICKNFGYYPEGIDYVKNTKKVTSEVLKKNGIKKCTIYEKDFIKWKTKKKYDLVSSFGFIEHFENPEEIVKKHIDLLKKGGKLIIEVPNFSGLRYFISKFIDQENLKRHNLKVMNLNFYKNISARYNLEINFLDYYGGFEYCSDNKNFNKIQKIFYLTFRILGKLKNVLNQRNKFFSSYIVFIAEKK